MSQLGADTDDLTGGKLKPASDKLADVIAKLKVAQSTDLGTPRTSFDQELVKAAEYNGQLLELITKGIDGLTKGDADGVDDLSQILADAEAENTKLSGSFGPSDTSHFRH